MKAFIQTSNFVRLLMNAVFLISNYVGIELGMKVQDADFLGSTLIALDFIWLAVIMVLTLVLSVFILLRIYSRFKLLLARESKNTSFTMKSFLRFVGLGLLMGLVFPFAFASFFLITFWLIGNL